MKRVIFVSFALVLVFATAPLGTAQEDPGSVSLLLDETVYLESPSGEVVEVPAGLYEVTVEEKTSVLRLVPVGGGDPLHVTAAATTHEEDVETHEVLTVPGENDLLHLMYLLPGKKAFEATGSFTGVFPRGWGSRLISKRLPKWRIRVARPTPRRGTIAVSQPGANVVWRHGERRAIVWKPSGSIYPYVSVTLMQGSRIKLRIQPRVRSTQGGVHWGVPASVRPGRYTIVVSTLDRRTTGRSPAFEVAAATTRPADLGTVESKPGPVQPAADAAPAQGEFRLGESPLADGSYTGSEPVDPKAECKLPDGRTMTLEQYYAALNGIQKGLLAQKRSLREPGDSLVLRRTAHDRTAEARQRKAIVDSHRAYDPRKMAKLRKFADLKSGLAKRAASAPPRLARPFVSKQPQRVGTRDLGGIELVSGGTPLGQGVQSEPRGEWNWTVGDRRYFAAHVNGAMWSECDLDRTDWWASVEGTATIQGKPKRLLKLDAHCQVPRSGEPRTSYTIYGPDRDPIYEIEDPAMRDIPETVLGPNFYHKVSGTYPICPLVSVSATWSLHGTVGVTFELGITHGPSAIGVVAKLKPQVLLETDCDAQLSYGIGAAGANFSLVLLNANIVLEASSMMAIDDGGTVQWTSYRKGYSTLQALKGKCELWAWIYAPTKWTWGIPTGWGKKWVRDEWYTPTAIAPEPGYLVEPETTTRTVGKLELEEKPEVPAEAPSQAAGDAGSAPFDLYVVKHQHTGSNRTEVHILDKATAYRTWKLHSATALPATWNQNYTVSHEFADWNGDGVTDLCCMIYSGGRDWDVSVKVLDGASYYKNYLWQGKTSAALRGYFPPNGVFQVLGDWDHDRYPDLFFFPSRTLTGHTGLKVVPGKVHFERVSLTPLVDCGSTGLHATDSQWALHMADYNRDGRADMFAIGRPDGKAAPRLHVHVLDAAQDFRVFIEHVGTDVVKHVPGQELDIDVGDWNGDGTPDIVCVDKRTNERGFEVVVLDGKSRYQSALFRVWRELCNPGDCFEFEVPSLSLRSSRVLIR